MSGSEPTIPEERAQAIWRRAARLQAEAERRMEERARTLAAADEPGAHSPGEGFRAGEVEAAAVEAGIAPEYVRIAMAEIATDPKAPAPLRGWEERAATRFLGTADRSLELARVVPAPLPLAVEAALRVLSAHPCVLQLRDVVDLPSLPGRAIVLDVPKYEWDGTSNPPFVESAAMVGLRRVHVTVRSLPGERGGCEVVISGDLERGVRNNWRFGALASGATGAAGAGAGVVAAASLGISGALLALPVAGGIALFAGVTAAVWGPTYRYYRRRVVEMLEESLRTLEASARAGGDPARALSAAPGKG